MASALASAQRALDPTTFSVTSPFPRSTYARFFHAYPRFGLSNDVGTTGGYIAGVLTAAVPWLLAGALCLAFGLGAGACCGGARARTRKRRRAARAARARDAPALVAGAAAFNGAFLLVGVGLVACFAFWNGLGDVFDAVAFGVDGLFGAAVGLARFAVLILERADDPQIAASIDALVPDHDAVLGEARSFVATAGGMLDTARGVLRAVRAAGTGAYAVLIVVFLCMLGGLFLLFTAQSVRRRTTACFTLAMLLPVVLAWVAAAVVNVAGVLAGDACVVLDDYHRLVLDESARLAGEAGAGFAAGVDPAGNLLYDNGLTCPRELLGTDVLDGVESFLTDVLDSELAVSIVGYLFDGQNAAGVLEFSSTLFASLRDCSSLVRFSGRLSQAMCQPVGPPMGLFFMWLTLLMLALLLTSVYFVAEYTAFDATRFYSPRNLDKKDKGVFSESSALDDESEGTSTSLGAEAAGSPFGVDVA